MNHYYSPEIEVIELHFGAVCTSFGDAGMAGIDPTESESYEL